MKNLKPASILMMKNFFALQTGRRQGCLLSPFLFHVALKVPSQDILARKQSQVYSHQKAEAKLS